MLDNNYPPKARGAFYFLVSTRGIFFVSVTYVRLRLLLAFSKNVRKLLSRSGTRALRDNNYPNKWRAHLFEAELPYFLTSLLPYFFTSLLPPSSPNSAPDPKVWREARSLGVNKTQQKKTHSAPILFTLSVSRASARSMALVSVNASKKKGAARAPSIQCKLCQTMHPPVQVHDARGPRVPTESEFRTCVDRASRTGSRQRGSIRASIDLLRSARHL